MVPRHVVRLHEPGPFNVGDDHLESRHHGEGHDGLPEKGGSHEAFLDDAL